jgi:hypothetical protein
MDRVERGPMEGTGLDIPSECLLSTCPAMGLLESGLGTPKFMSSATDQWAQVPFVPPRDAEGEELHR